MRPMKAKLRILCAGVALCGVAEAVPVLFDRAGVAPAPIVVPKGATPSQRYAASEYAFYLREMTGEDVSVIEGDAPKRCVRIVTAQEREGLGEDGFTLRVRGETLEVRGSGVRGCLYGVYELLERFGGCRWYSSDWVRIPKVSRLTVPDGLDVTERPAFAMRQTWWYDVMRHPHFAARLKLNGFNHTELPVPEEIGGDSFRFGGGLPSCHTFETLLPTKTYFKEHPEYFSLVNGKREPGPQSQLCLTNPDVFRIVLSNLLARIRSDPGARFYGVSQNDWYNDCQCTNCQVVCAEEGSRAGTNVRFVNALAEAVERECPGVLIETLAYQWTVDAPKKTRLRPNVVTCLCTHGGDMARPYATSTDTFNSEFRANIAQWRTQGRGLYVWDYATLFGMLPLICPDEKSYASNLRFYRDNGVKALFMQGCGAGRGSYLDAMKVWLLAKLMWNPDQDQEALEKDFTDGYYGAAAPLVREDLAAVRRVFLESGARLFCEDKMPLKQMPESYFAESRQRLTKALDAVAGDVDLEYHVKELLFSLDFTDLERLRAAKAEKDWSARDRGTAAVLARRLLAFLAVARDEVKLSYHFGANAVFTDVWKRLAADGAEKEGLDPLVSLFLNSSTWLPDDALPQETMRKLSSEYGLRRFMFDPPGLRHGCGRGGPALHVRIGESFAAAGKALEGTGVEIGWFDRPTLAWNHHTKCQHIMDCDGNESSGFCPLDAAAASAHIANLKKTVELGRPRLVIIEDDLNLSGHSGTVSDHGGCFCPLHMAAFARRIGRTMTAREAGALFDAPTAANEPLRRAFAQLSKESLVQFCRRVRQAIDEVDPTIRVCLCQSAQVDLDGDTTEANVRALAGGVRPMTRVYGAAYFSENVSADLPKTLAHTFYSMQHLPRDIEMIYEADVFPHTRFYNSTLFYKSEIAAAFMAGAEDLLLFCVRTAEDPLADRAYLDMFRANRRRFAAVRDFRRKASLTGVRAVYRADERALFRTRKHDMLAEGARVLAKFGLPMTTLPSNASVLFGATAERLPEQEIRDLFKGATIVDSTAALALAKRGLADLLGCTVADAEGDLEFPRSRVLPVAGSRLHGINSYDYKLLVPATPVPGWDLKMDYVRITPGPSSETWIRYEDVDGRELSPAFVCSKNALGGTVGVMAFAVEGNFREWLYSPEMQDVFRNFFDRGTQGRMDVVSTRTPSVWLAAAVSDDGRELLVMANNLAGETRDDVTLEFAAKWRGGTVARLQEDGTWCDVGVADAAFRPRDGRPFAHMTPEFLKVTRKGDGR